jgi:FixJ family two-component response regulator
MVQAVSSHDGSSERRTSPGAEARQIMIVDDDAVVLDALERLLVMWGYRTRAFNRFEDARASLGMPGLPSRPPQAEAPDALIVDIRLGEYNGLQLVHLAKQLNPEMTIVVVSGFDDPVLRTEAARAGAAYLLKPAELQRLKEYLPPPTAN